MLVVLVNKQKRK